MHIRPAVNTDKAFIVGLAHRLTEFGAVPGRDPEQMIARDKEVLTQALDQPSPDTAVFVAVDDDANPLGFIHVTTTDDYYTNHRTCHIADVVVAREAGGRGVGTALMAFAEEWARQRGFAMLTLSVFTANHRARELYRRLDFREEWIRCVKRL